MALPMEDQTQGSMILEDSKARKKGGGVGQVPLPRGPFSGKRTPLRRFCAYGISLVNRLVDKIPFSSFLHGLSWKRLEFNNVPMGIVSPGSELEGFTIAFLSDLHAGSCMSEEDLCVIFSRVSSLSPDLVCLGGDLINTREREILLFRKPLELLKPPYGVYCVPGNHDHFWGQDIGLWESFLSQQGVHVLNNRGAHISKGNAKFFLAGVDDFTEGSPCLERALRGREDGEPTILLSHHPDLFFEAAANGIDLTLAGHTHGGQIRFFGWSPINHSHFGWIEGAYELEGAKLYVGRGVGTTVLPLRIGTRAEIPLIRLVSRAPLSPPSF